jgi:hypothetical protein
MRTGNTLLDVLIGAGVGAAVAVVVYYLGLPLLVGLMAFLGSNTSTTAETVPEWRLRVSSPTASRIEVEWHCDLTTGSSTQTRGGTTQASSMGENVFRGHGGRISCVLWKRGPGKLLVTLYRNAEIEQQVESTVDHDLINVFSHVD